MIATIFHKGKEYRVDFFKPIDISISYKASEHSVSAWYVKPVSIEPVVMGEWVGDVKQGGSVNFRNIHFNPHGNGTHTECVGHISREDFSVNKTFARFMFIAELITLLPQQLDNGDFVITRAMLEVSLDGSINTEALIIRTLSNGLNKLTMQYSNTNPPYMLKEAIEYINERGIQHLLIDLPSVDKEVDGGRLLAHHAFWNYPQKPELEKSITELVYVPNEVFDGTYLIQFQVAPFENDASPSRPVLYQVYT